MANSKRVGLLAILIILISNFVYAQKYNTLSYTVNDGLPASTVFDIKSDKNGYLWFVTPVGVIQYSGSEYKTFTEDAGLKDDVAYSILSDKYGDIWVSTEFGGLARYENDRFVYPKELEVLDSTVINYVVESNNEFWISTEDQGVLIWYRDTNEFDTLNTDSGLPDNQVWDIYFNRDEIWIPTMGGIVRYDREIGVEEVLTLESGLSGEYTYQVTADNNDNIWIATNNGVTVYQRTGKLESITQINGVELGSVYTVTKLDDGTIWIGTERKGIFSYKNGEFAQITKKNGLSSNYVYRFSHDQRGFMWVTTDGHGVTAFKDMNLLSYDDDSPFDNNHVYSLLVATDETIWLGMESEIASFKDGDFKKYQIPLNLFDEVEIWRIEELPNGNLLLLTHSLGLIEFDGSRFFEPDFFSKLDDTYIYEVMTETDGTIWLSVFGYLYRIRNSIVDVFETPEDYYWQQSINSIFRDSYGVLWLGTEAGIATFSDGKFTYYGESTGLIGESIYELVEDPSGNLWVGSGEGISYAKRSDLEAGNIIFNDFFSKELLNQETIFLQFDNYGGLWQGTNTGLNYFDVQKSLDENRLFEVHFDLSDNGIGTEFHGAARGIDKDGTLWFGTNTRGLVSYTFHNDSGKVEIPEPPGIFLREVYSNNKLIYDQLQDNAISPQLSMPYRENDLVFKFNAIDYLNPFGITIRYKLEGYDEDWQQATDITEIRYTNVPWGNFKLLVSAKSAKSFDSEVVNLASIRVKSPFFLTIPFFVVVGLFLIWLVGMYVNYKVSHIEKKELQTLVDIQTEELTKALKEKEVLIKEIHHRVKNNLAVVSGLLELQSFRMPPGESKEAIIESKMRVIAISKIHENLYQNHDLANVDFKKFINELIKSNKAVISLNHQKIEVVENIEQVFLNVNIGVPLALIINELVSNCFKHAFKERNEGTVTITFSKEPNSYLLIVKDDGCGADEELLTKKSKSLGITLIKSLIEQLRGFITYKNENGSQFIIEIPRTEEEG